MTSSAALVAKLVAARVTLGVGADASAADIRAAYLREARKSHPDKSSDSDATRLFQEVTAAYAMLRKHQVATSRAHATSAACAPANTGPANNAPANTAPANKTAPDGRKFDPGRTGESVWKAATASFAPAQASPTAQPTSSPVETQNDGGGEGFACCPLRTVVCTPAPPGWTFARAGKILGSFGMVVGVWVAVGNEAALGVGGCVGLATFKHADAAAESTIKPITVPMAPGNNKPLRVQLELLLDRDDLLPIVRRTTPPAAVVSLLDSERRASKTQRSSANEKPPVPSGGGNHSVGPGYEVPVVPGVMTSPAANLVPSAGTAASPPLHDLIPGKDPLWHFTKVSPCPRFLQGEACRMGSSCPMAHTLAELAKARRPFRRAILEDASSGSSSSSSSSYSDPRSRRREAPRKPHSRPRSSRRPSRTRGAGEGSQTRSSRFRSPGHGVWAGTDFSRSRSRGRGKHGDDSGLHTDYRVGSCA